MTRRQTALLLVSIAWLANGITIWHQPGYRDLDEAIIFEVWPLWVRIGIWLVCGLAGVLLALARRPRAESLGWALAVVPPLIRLVGYGWSVAAWIIPGAPGGEPAALAYGAYWSALLVLVWWLARWPEPVTERTTDA